jgi:hypothetical protein
MGEFSFFQFELPDASETEGKYYVVKVSLVDAIGRPREKISQKEWARTTELCSRRSVWLAVPDPAVLYRRFCNRSAENQKLVPLRCSRRFSGVRTRSTSLGPLGPSASSRSSARRSSRFSAWVSFGNSAMISLIVMNH